MILKHAAGQVFTDPARFRALVAGRRFGKSRLVLCELMRAAAKPRSNCWYIAPTYRQARQIMWGVLKSETPPEFIRKANETDLSLELINGSVIALRGADNPDSLRGVSLHFAAFDEYDFIDPAVWPAVIRPMLTTTGGRAIFTGTPDGYGPLYDLYLRGKSVKADDADWSAHQYTTLDGGWVPAQEIEDAKRDSDERTFRQEYLASFETMSGRVYYAFDRDANVKEPPQYAGPLAMGMDFNVDPMTATIFFEDTTTTWVIDEIVIKSSNTQECIDEARRRYGPRIVSAYPDPAGRGRSTSAPVGYSDHAILRDAGLTVYVRGQVSLKDGINALNARLCSADGKRHLFVAPKCKHLIAALDRHCYKQGAPIPDQDGHEHVTDSIKYAMHYIHPIRTVAQWTQGGRTNGD